MLYFTQDVARMGKSAIAPRLTGAQRAGRSGRARPRFRRVGLPVFMPRRTAPARRQSPVFPFGSAPVFRSRASGARPHPGKRTRGHETRLWAGSPLSGRVRRVRGRKKRRLPTGIDAAWDISAIIFSIANKYWPESCRLLAYFCQMAIIISIERPAPTCAGHDKSEV